MLKVIKSHILGDFLSELRSSFLNLVKPMYAEPMWISILLSDKSWKKKTQEFQEKQIMWRLQHHW